MHDKIKLRMILIFHRVVFFVMVASVFYTLYCGISRTRNEYLVIAVILVMTEGLALSLSNFKCPFTILAIKLGATENYLFDPYFPKHLTKYTFPVFGLIFAVGLVLLFFLK